MSLSYQPSVRSDGPLVPLALHRQNYVSGDRSLASCLAGGDLDGYVICGLQTLVWFIRFSRDTYDIYIANPALLPTIHQDPAPISESSVLRLEEGEPDATVDDICKFIVEYINSDVMVRSLLGLHTLTEAHTFFANHRACYRTGTSPSRISRRCDGYFIWSIICLLISDRTAYSTTGA
jgi:hypothetical protein